MFLRGTLCAAVAAFALPAAAAATPLVLITPDPNRLERFDSSAPGTRTNVPIAPAPPAQPRGIDWRGATGELVWLSATGGLDSVVLQPNGASATFQNVGPDLSASGSFSPSGFHGIDVNPAVDRVRVVEDDEDNYRLDPNSGALTADTDIDPSGLQISSVAYDAGSPPTLYGIARTTPARLVRIGGVGGAPSPNTGAATVIGELGVAITDGKTGFDIGQDGVAWAALESGASRRLYRIDLATGSATDAGEISTTTDIEGLAVLPAGVLSLDAVDPVPEGDAATVTVRRSGGAFGAVSVNVSVVAGSAGTADLDSAGGVVTFGEGETVKTFTIATREDSADEPAESATVRLSAPAGGAIVGGGDEVTLVVNDDDPAPPSTPSPATTAPPAATPTPVATAPDRLAPLLLAVPPDRIRLRTLRRSGLSVALASTEACTLRLRLLAGTRVLGTATVRFTGASMRRARVRLSPSGRRALRSPRRLTLSLRGVDAAGNVATRRVGVRVSR